jgi:K+-transporting ATPase ATPase C chain
MNLRDMRGETTVTQLDESAHHHAEPSPSSSFSTELRCQLRPLLFSVPILTVLTGVLFPLALFAIVRPMFPHQAGGSLASRNGVVVGSDVIGQDFKHPSYFHPRPSATDSFPYNATASGGTNLGPGNTKLVDGDKSDPDNPFIGVSELTETYRRQNDLPPDATVPIDAVTRSGSGLDPHISPENAALQIARVARERHMTEDDVNRLVAEHTKGRQLRFLGERRVDVLALNLALDRMAPMSSLTADR